MAGRPLRIPEDLWISFNDEPELGINLLQKGIQRVLVAGGLRETHYQRTHAVRLFARVLNKLGVIRPLVRCRREAVVLVTVWASSAPLWPATYLHEVIPWIFDCWGPQFPRWEKLLRRHRIRTVFFTARDARDYFAARIPGLEAHWLPEACDPSRFFPDKPLAQRAVHVLEMGRKHTNVHERIRPALEAAGKRHLYSTPQRPELFTTLEDLYRGVGDTVVCLCFPKTVSHPQNAGGVETMTQRYLEAIGSGAIAAGVCPAELKDLFGFSPVIELREEDTPRVILDILSRPQDFQAHADRCRARLLEVGTFEARGRTMLETLRATRSGAQPPG